MESFTKNFKVRSRGVTDLSNDYLDFLGEYKAICETALARESGPFGRLFDEKKPRV
jgi:hypothetical protein